MTTGTRGTAAWGSRGRCPVRHHQEAAQPAQLLLHRVAQIAHEMKAIRDLARLRRAAADAVGVRPVPITADDPNAGMDREPVGHRIGGAHREHIDDAAPLQVHEDRAEMLLPLLPGPVIDAHDAQGLVDVGWRGAAFDDAHHRVGADRHAQPGQQALAGAPAQRMTHQMHDDAQPMRVLARAAPRPPAIVRRRWRSRTGDCGTATD